MFYCRLVFGALFFLGAAATELAADPRDASNAKAREISPPTQIGSYKLPWDARQNHWRRLRKSPGWHGDGWTGMDYCLDFEPYFSRIQPEKPAPILASAPGTVVAIKRCRDTANLLVEHLDGNFVYAHLDGASVRVAEGDPVHTGSYLGDLYNGHFDDACGWGTSTHIHICFPSPDLVVDGRAVRDYAELDFRSREYHYADLRYPAEVYSSNRMPAGAGSPSLARETLEAGTRVEPSAIATQQSASDRGRGNTAAGADRRSHGHPEPAATCRHGAAPGPAPQE